MKTLKKRNNYRTIQGVASSLLLIGAAANVNAGMISDVTGKDVNEVSWLKNNG
ncbi:MAG: hypothetical protein RLZZ384_1010, partial [Pseudomonadota bacterium]